MKNGWFTIKEVSDLFDNTRGAIRFYEEKGLIHPQRDEHDFRWYSIDDIFQLFYLKRYASMIEGPSGWRSVTSLGIIEANARAAGIPLHPKMRKLPGSLAAVRCVRCEWDAMPGQLIEKALAFRDEVIASGKTVHSFVSTSLILVHTQEGKTIEYHKCYVPFRDC